MPPLQADDRREREGDAVRHFVRVGRDPVVVADADVLPEAEHRNEHEAGHRRREAVRELGDQAVQHRYGGSENRDVAPEEDVQPRAERPEQEAVRVRRQWTVEPRDVSVQSVALGQTPRHVGLAAEVHERVGPRSPRPDEHRGARGNERGRAQSAHA
jgi:hypothetical protein